MQKYRSLTAANFPGGVRPEIYLDEAPQQKADGTQLFPPYVIVRDLSANPNWSPGESMAAYTGRATFTVRYQSLDNCVRWWSVMMWNGLPKIAKAGVALSQLDVAAPFISGPITVFPGAWAQGHDYTDPNDQRVYTLRQDFTLRYWLQ
jgi:hypothetical protein